MSKIITICMLLFTFSASGQSKRDSIWAPMQHFIGTWTGEGGGEPGIGNYERSYAFILNKNFIEVRNKSSYPPTARNPKGEVHEDIGHIFYDRNRKTFLLRQLHIEGFANDFALDSISGDRKTLIFMSDAIVNIPKGWRARETYRITGPNELEETFELAPPGKEFAIYSSVKLKRN
jgi:hypothetical protein